MKGIQVMWLSSLLILSLLVPSSRSDSNEETNPDIEETVVSDQYDSSNSTDAQAENEMPTSPRETFHLGPVMTDWDEQRAKWLQENPNMRLNRNGKPRMILVTASQAEPCPSPLGDYYLLKAMKNKVDYTGLHDIDFYYNMAIMDPLMTEFFIKHPTIRKLMVTHPETEWIWWMDSDAYFTDMTFEIPLERYRDHNMIIHGWDAAVYERKNWVGLNAGIFLVRNCQWSLDMLDLWGAIGEDFDGHKEEMGNVLYEALDGRPKFPSDDQSGLVYLLTTSHTDLLKPKVFLESSYALHGYWVWAMGKHDELLKDSPQRTVDEEYWPFITHFVGCKACTGTYASYNLNLCLTEMERAFNLADNQVLHTVGYEHENLTSTQVKRSRSDWHRPLDYLLKSSLEFLLQNPWTGATTRIKTALTG